MNLAMETAGGAPVAVVDDKSWVMRDTRDALNLMADARHLHGADAVVVPKENIGEEFFDLRTGIAGEILQKYSNYGMKIAIAGDFSGHGSKALRDFMYESNKGGRVLFVADVAAALERLAVSR